MTSGGNSQLAYFPENQLTTFSWIL